MSRKHPKGGPRQPHPHPDQDHAKHNKGDVTGSIHMTCEIEAKTSPGLTDKTDSERTQNASRDQTRFVVEVVTLIVVAIYAALTWWQAHATQRIANLTRDQFTSDERAWVGPVSIGLADPPIAVGKTVTAVIELRNSGKTPAKRVATLVSIQVVSRDARLVPKYAVD